MFTHLSRGEMGVCVKHNTSRLLKEVINSGLPFPTKVGEKARLFASCGWITTAPQQQRVVGSACVFQSL